MPKVVIGSGSTSPQDWQAYTGAGGPGIFVDVDTSHAHFPETPVYVCALYGDSEHWDTVGGSSIYFPSPTSFRVYVRRRPQVGLTVSDAARLRWRVGWIGQYIHFPFPEGPDPEQPIPS
jgi:hypothetical protein